jgi:hypothetical protein
MGDLIGYFIGMLWALQVLLIIRLVLQSATKKILLSTMIFVVLLFLFGQIIQQDSHGILLESCVLIIELGLVFLAKKFDFRWLAIAFILHGCWDLMDILNTVNIEKTLLNSQICVPYDWMIGTFILLNKWKTL